MIEVEACRTLVKSPPELWSELSDAALLGRLLEQQFGAIQITRSRPEQLLVWQGAETGGTVELSPSGWGTKVRLTVYVPDWALPAPAEAALASVLDEVGTAHHRPFSRN
jgi:hypothetical protein